MSIHCNSLIKNIWLHPLCTWCPPPTRSWRGKCRFPFCSSSPLAVIQLEGFTDQHDPPCMLLLLHMSSCNYMTLTMPLILFLAFCFLALDHPGLPNYTKWGRTEENCSVSGKVVFFHMNFLFLKKFWSFLCPHLNTFNQTYFFPTRPNQSFSPRLWSMPTPTFWGSVPLVSLLSIVLLLHVLP